MTGMDERLKPTDRELDANLRAAARGPWRDYFTAGARDRNFQMIAIASSVLAIIALGAAVHAARWLLIPIATAFVISILLAPAADSLRRLRLPETARAAIVVALTIFAVLAAVYFLARPAITFSERLPEVVSQARDKLTGVEKAVTAVQEMTDEVDKITDLEPRREKPQEVVLAETSVPQAIASSTRLIVVQSLFIAVLVFFFLAARSDFKQKAMMAPRSLRGRLQAARIMRDIEKNVGSYMFTMLIINFGLGLATGLAMWALGAPSPMLWGALAGLLNFLPYIGPIAISILLALMGVVNFDTGLGMAAPALVYIALNFVESNFITPALVGVRLRLTPIAIILAVSFWTWIWGPIGAVISIPMLIILKAACDRIDALNPLGVLIGDISPIRRREVRNFRVKTYAK